jgi:hypothetical protein
MKHRVEIKAWESVKINGFGTGLCGGHGTVNGKPFKAGELPNTANSTDSTSVIIRVYEGDVTKGERVAISKAIKGGMR